MWSLLRDAGLLGLVVYLAALLVASVYIGMAMATDSWRPIRANRRRQAQADAIVAEHQRAREEVERGQGQG